jgi:phage terminase small subunit
MNDNLPPKQLRFVEEYLKTLNATQAYKAAGYTAASDEVAAVEGHKLLRKPKVAEEATRDR